MVFPPMGRPRSGTHGGEKVVTAAYLATEDTVVATPLAAGTRQTRTCPSVCKLCWERDLRSSVYLPGRPEYLRSVHRFGR